MWDSGHPQKNYVIHLKIMKINRHISRLPIQLLWFKADSQLRWVLPLIQPKFVLAQKNNSQSDSTLSKLRSAWPKVRYFFSFSNPYNGSQLKLPRFQLIEQSTSAEPHDRPITRPLSGPDRNDQNPMTEGMTFGHMGCRTAWPEVLRSGPFGESTQGSWVIYSCNTQLRWVLICKKKKVKI